MKSWLRRIRGAVGVGLTWAAGWGAYGFIRWLIPIGAASGFEFALDVALNLALDYAFIGFVGGTIFATALRLAEGRRRFDELRLPPFAGWGAVGGLLVGAAYVAVSSYWWAMRDPSAVPLFGQTSVLIEWLATTSVLGGLTAAGSLALARAADDRELLQEGVEAGDVGLSEGERRDLLREVD